MLYTLSQQSTAVRFALFFCGTVVRLRVKWLIKLILVVDTSAGD